MRKFSHSGKKRDNPVLSPSWKEKRSTQSENERKVSSFSKRIDFTSFSRKVTTSPYFSSEKTKSASFQKGKKRNSLTNENLKKHWARETEAIHWRRRNSLHFMKLNSIWSLSGYKKTKLSSATHVLYFWIEMRRKESGWNYLNDIRKTVVVVPLYTLINTAKKSQKAPDVVFLYRLISWW